MKLVGILCVVALMVITLSVIGCVFSYTGRVATVVQQQIDPAELLRKYELFKDESAQLDAKIADIHVKAAEIKEVRAIPNKDRVDREDLQLQLQEFSGLKYSYNALASDYNAQMVKWNYKFCNVGDLPPGASTPLPRSYKPYIEE